MVMRNKGLAWVWGAFLICLLMISLVYTFFNKALSVANPELKNMLNETYNQTNSSFASNALYVNDILSSTWQYFLLIFIIGELIWIVVQAQRRQ